MGNSFWKPLIVTLLIALTSYICIISLPTPYNNTRGLYKKYLPEKTPVLKNSISNQKHYKELQTRAQQIFNFKSTPKPSISNTTPSYKVPKSKKPLCLITTMESEKFPEHSKLSVESISRSDDYVRLYIFTHQVWDQPDVSNQKNVHMYELGDINEEYRDIIMGFPRFVADRICPYYGLRVDSPECNHVYSILLWQQYRTDWAPKSILQLRGMFGVIFKEWLNPDLCDAWAWITLDSVYGDFGGWFNKNPLFWESDVVTITASNWNSFHARAQFTAHIQTRNPVIVNEIWRNCSIISNYTTFKKEFIYFGDHLAESCYSRAIADETTNNNLVFTLLEWQANDWDSTKITYVFMEQKYLITSENCEDIPRCGVRVGMVFDQKINELEKFPQKGRYSPDIPPIKIPLSIVHTNVCSKRFPAHYTTCIESFRPLSAYNIITRLDDMNIALTVHKGKAEMIMWDKSELEVNFADNGMKEILMFYMSGPVGKTGLVWDKYPKTIEMFFEDPSKTLLVKQPIDERKLEITPMKANE